jgi:hypothetical protein
MMRRMRDDEMIGIRMKTVVLRGSIGMALGF